MGNLETQKKTRHTQKNDYTFFSYKSKTSLTTMFHLHSEVVFLCVSDLVGKHKVMKVFPCWS